MTAYVNYTDPLLVYAEGNSISGTNWLDNRSTFYPVGAIVFDSGGLTSTQWYKDRGPVGMPNENKEPRAFCNRGGCHFSFTGRTLILRVNVAWSWYKTTTIKIDGVSPSTLGLLTAKDTISCDAADYGLINDTYIDVIVADGLTNTLHTVALLTNNTLFPSQFFSIAGFKVGTLTPQDLIIVNPQWLHPDELPVNVMNMKLKNRKSIMVQNATITFGAGLDVPSYTFPEIAAGQEVAITNIPIHTGEEAEGTRDYSAHLVANYPDPAGSIVVNTPLSIIAGSPSLTFTPSPWFTDAAGPGGVTRNYCNARTTTGQPWVLSFTFEGDALDITVSCSAGWGFLGLYNGPTDGATLINSINCGLNEAEAAHTFNFTGFGAGLHTMYLRKRDADALFVTFLHANWIKTLNYSTVTEDFLIKTTTRQPVAMLAEGVQLKPDGYDFTWVPPSPSENDLVGPPVRVNTEIARTETLARFATYAVFYGTGYRELLSEYDMLILDPIGADPADVIYWQSLGIKCYGYICFGQEVGFYQDRYDFTSPITARSDGTGPGGYSKNYMFTTNPVAGPPDKDGVWSAYFMSPFPDSGWEQRVVDYYLPQVFDGPGVIVNESVVTKAHTIVAGPRIVFDTAISPIDGGQDIILKTADSSHTFVRYQDYTYDVKTGAFVMAPTVIPSVAAGQTLLISYTRKGHNMDGMFWDVVDSVDTFGSSDWGFEFVPGYNEAAINFLNDVNNLHPNKEHIFNRGFTILRDIIKTGTGVMFESWLTLPNDFGDLINTDYYRIEDQPTIDFNEACNELLRELRRDHVFDVFSLNYAVNGPEGDVLREYCRSMDAQRGYLSWVSIMTLTNPSHNEAIEIPEPHVQTSEFRLIKYQKSGAEITWDEPTITWDDGATVWW